MSKFDEVITEANLSDNDKIAVELFAFYLLNTTPGYRPSDAARRAVSLFTLNPDAIRNRESGQYPEFSRYA